MLLNLLGFALHVVALQSLPLFLVQVALAASVAVTAVLSVLLLHNPLGPRQWAAVLAVCAGLGLLSTSARSGEAATTGTGLRIGLLVAVLVVAAAGDGCRPARRRPLGAAAARAGRRQRLRAARGVGAAAAAGLAPGEVVADPALYVLVLAGATAFLLYATAMQKGSVTLTTATLVLTQTAVPAVLGIALLDDGVRPGTAPFAVARLPARPHRGRGARAFEHGASEPAPSRPPPDRTA